MSQDASTPAPNPDGRPDGIAPEVWAEYANRQREAQIGQLHEANKLISSAAGPVPPPSPAELLVMLERSKAQQPGGAYGLRGGPGVARGGFSGVR